MSAQVEHTAATLPVRARMNGVCYEHVHLFKIFKLSSRHSNESQARTEGQGRATAVRQQDAPPQLLLAASLLAISLRSTEKCPITYY